MKDESMMELDWVIVCVKVYGRRWARHMEALPPFLGRLGADIGRVPGSCGLRKSRVTSDTSR